MRTNGMSEAGALGIEGGPDPERMRIAEELLNRSFHLRSGSPEAIAADEECNRIWGIDVSGENEVASAGAMQKVRTYEPGAADANGSSGTVAAALSPQNNSTPPTEHPPLTSIGAAPSRRAIRSIDDIGRTEDDDLIDSGLSEKEFWKCVKERKQARAAANGNGEQQGFGQDSNSQPTATADRNVRPPDPLASGALENTTTGIEQDSNSQPTATTGGQAASATGFGQDSNSQPTANTGGQGGEGRSQNSATIQNNATSQLKYPPAKRAWTAKDLETGNAEEHTWHGFLAPGAITLMHSLPKRGKTFLAFGLIRELLRGQPFLNRPTRKSGVVYLSEEGRETLRTKFERFGITDADPFWVYSRRDPRFAKDSLKESISRACALAVEHKAELVVMDTLSAWAGREGHAENCAARMEDIFHLLKAEVEKNRLALWIMHHTEKDGSSARGSGAMEGAADVIIQLKAENLSSKKRSLHVISRLSEMAPQLHYWITPDGFETMEDRREKKLNTVLEYIPEGPPGISVSELSDKTGLIRQRLHERLKSLRKRNLIELPKSGSRDAYQIWKINPEKQAQS